MKRFRSPVILVVLLFCLITILQGCQNPNEEKKDSLSSNKNTGEDKVSSESIYSTWDEQRTKDDITDARDLIQRAFGENMNNITPILDDSMSPVKSISFVPDESDVNNRYVVLLVSGSDYPECIYHFHHENTDKIDIATDDSFQFNTGSIDIAREFLDTLYQIDVQPVSIKAYGYQNKIAVQFTFSDDKCFDIRMYYEDYEPVGCFYISNKEDRNKWLNLNNAKIFYET